MAFPPVKVEGLAEFRRDLKQMGTALPKELRLGFKKIADHVADDTRSSFSGRGGVAPKVAASVKSSAQQTGAAVQFGGDQYPWAMGAEFGSSQFTQFPSWRGSGQDAGYSFYPSIRKAREHIVDDVAQMLDHVARLAFPE